MHQEGKWVCSGKVVAHTNLMTPDKSHSSSSKKIKSRFRTNISGCNYFPSCLPLPIDLSLHFYLFIFYSCIFKILLSQESSSLEVFKVKTIVVKMENRSNFYHWPTTVWLSSSSLCSSENAARPHTEAELQHFEKKKNTNGKSNWISKYEVVGIAESF